MFSFLLPPEQNEGIGLAFTDRLDGFSSGSLGSLNLGRVDVDRVADLRDNAGAVREALGIPPWVALEQVHGTAVHVVDEHAAAALEADSWLGAVAGAPELPQADAAVTALAGVPLMIRVADCVPVLLADRHSGVVGAVHAGRAGFDAGVLDRALEEMRALGAREVTAWIGPHICGACYEVDEELAAAIDARHPGVRTLTPRGTAALDLGAGCEAELVRSGVRVHRVDPCTRTTPSLHSYRREGTGAGRLAGIIWRVSPQAGRPNPHGVR